MSINHSGLYKSWQAFRFQGRQFLALDRGDSVEIYGDATLTPMYAWVTIANFKQHAKAGKLPEFFPPKNRRK